MRLPTSFQHHSMELVRYYECMSYSAFPDILLTDVLLASAMYGQSWDLETELNRVGGENGWIATQVMKTVSSDGSLRRWQWELRKNKRPPCLGCWKIESIGSSDRNGDFEARDRGGGWIE